MKPTEQFWVGLGIAAILLGFGDCQMMNAHAERIKAEATRMEVKQ